MSKRQEELIEIKDRLKYICDELHSIRQLTVTNETPEAMADIKITLDELAEDSEVLVRIIYKIVSLYNS